MGQCEHEHEAPGRLGREWLRGLWYRSRVALSSKGMGSKDGSPPKRTRSASTGRAWQDWLRRRRTEPCRDSSRMPSCATALWSELNRSSSPSNFAAARPISEGPISPTLFQRMTVGRRHSTAFHCLALSLVPRAIPWERRQTEGCRAAPDAANPAPERVHSKRAYRRHEKDFLGARAQGTANASAIASGMSLQSADEALEIHEVIRGANKEKRQSALSYAQGSEPTVPEFGGCHTSSTRTWQRNTWGRDGLTRLELHASRHDVHSTIRAITLAIRRG